MPLYCSLDMQGAFIPDLHTSICWPGICIWWLFFTNKYYYLLAPFLKNWPLKHVFRGHFGPQVKLSGWNTDNSWKLLCYNNYSILFFWWACSKFLCKVNNFIIDVDSWSIIKGLTILTAVFSCPERDKECLKLAVSLVKIVYWLLIVVTRLLKLCIEVSGLYQFIYLLKS